MSNFEEVQSYLTRGITPSKQEFQGDNYADIFQLQYLQHWIKNQKIQEILIHSPKLVELRTLGGAQFEKLSISQEVLDLSFEVFCSSQKISWNYSKPFQSLGVEIQGQKFRLSLCHNSILSGNKKYFLRRREAQHFNINTFGISESFLKTKNILLKKNIIIAGDTGSGKTSFLQSLLSICPVSEHIITIEDTREIFFKRENVTSLFSDNLNELKDFCSMALRMSPDRLILGEMRSHEVVPFSLLMTGGHKGLMSTIHANSSLEAIERLSLLFQLYSPSVQHWDTLQKLFCNSIDFIFFLQNKEIQEVIELKNYTNGIYHYEKLYKKRPTI